MFMTTERMAKEVLCYQRFLDSADSIPQATLAIGVIENNPKNFGEPLETEEYS